MYLKLKPSYLPKNVEEEYFICKLANIASFSLNGIVDESFTMYNGKYNVVELYISKKNKIKDLLLNFKNATWPLKLNNKFINFSFKLYNL